MKINIFSSEIQTGILAGVLLLACASASAIPTTSISVTVDENGNASGAGNVFSQGFMGVEEWSSSGWVLKYAIPDYYGTTYPNAGGGVVLIYDDAAHTILSDVISFFPDGAFYLEFMSLDNGGDLADVSSIPFNYTYLAQVALTEGANGNTTYAPTIGQPGYLDGGVTYTFESDPPTVPDAGSSAMLLGMGVIAVGALRRKLNKLS